MTARPHIIMKTLKRESNNQLCLALGIMCCMWCSYWITDTSIQTFSQCTYDHVANGQKFNTVHFKDLQC